ncbi:cupin domain-containing protein [Terriglobus aquaticus]|uniref:Cupin domain-containing protein n=1 Tax=Terriglobus aquaticus TaxID=940139 RepID=A0ABW9KMW5_9BACT|nr:cupin domain-containing protein [Terriglobus aquaticus]
MTSRRDFLASSATAAAAITTAMGQTAQNTREADRDHSSSNPGQSNTGLVALNPNSNMPPPTDHGAVPPIWYSFDLTHRRVQEGGWTHEVTERDLPDSKEIAGVNMRLTKGSYRELHWHVADEWAIMLKGNARVTVLSPDGSMFIDDVAEGDLWLFPAGYPHSIQGTGDDGCEFLLVFNQGSFSEESTFLISDWLKHTPPDVLQKNFKLDAAAISKLPKGEPLYIFPSDPPHQTLAQDRAESASHAPASKQVFTFRPSQMKPTKESENGHLRVIDSHNFPASTKIAAGLVTLKPGGLRELHWHPSGSEWQFWIAGQGRMTVFNAKEAARTMDFHANDVGYVPSMAGHYIENTGTTDLVYLEMFATGKYSEVSLNQWLRALPAQVAMAHTNLSAEDLARIPREANAIL